MGRKPANESTKATTAAAASQPPAPAAVHELVALLQKQANSAGIAQILRDRMPQAKAGAADEAKTATVTLFTGMIPQDVTACWRALAAHVPAALDALAAHPDAEDDDDDDVAPKAPSREDHALEYLRAVLALIDAVLKLEKKAEVPAELGDVVFTLHDSLLRLNAEKAADVQERIAAVCEAWFTQELPGKERVAPQTISFLLLQSLRDDAKVADVKLVYNLRKTLLLLDFSDPSSDSLKNLVLFTYMNANYLQAPEGRKFLVFCLGLHVPLIDHIYQTIKNQIPSAGKPALEAYGEVLFKAWSTAQGPYLHRLEYACVQDLMNHAVHAPSKGANPMSARLQKVLAAFHAQKSQPGVDEMLHRLYEPILWRSLRVANPVVRRNSAMLLVDAFPLQDPDASNEEIDQMLQRQFDALQAMLQDPSSAVRQVGIEGVCHIFARFWELIPATVLNDFLNQLINDLAFDSSDVNSRAAVLEGLRYLMENTPLCHSFLKKKLVKLGPLLHDNSERVRTAFLELLLQIKSVPDIKFWDIVEISQLLVRLEVDGLKVAKQIVSLLSNSFFPHKKDADAQVERCLVLLDENPESARRFYYFLPKYADGDQVLDFSLKLYETVHQQILDHAADPDENAPQQGKGGKKGKGRQARPPPQGKTLSPQVLERGLDTVAITIESLFAHARGKKEKELTKAVADKFRECPLEDLAAALPTPSVQASVMTLAAHLSAKDVANICDTALSRLQSGDAASSDSAVDVASTMKGIWHWGQFEKVLTLVADWLGGSILGTTTSKFGKLAKKGGGKLSVEDLGNLAAPQKPALALRYLDVILGDGELRAEFLPKSDRVFVLLSTSLNVLDLLASGVDLSDTAVDDMQLRLLAAGLEALAKLEIHRRAAGLSEGTILDVLASKIDARFLTTLFEDKTQQQQKSKKRKAPATSAEFSVGWLAVIEALQKVTIEFVSLGLGEPSTYEKLVHSTRELLLEARGSEWLGLVPHVAKLVYQLNTLCVVSQIGAGKDLDDDGAIDFKLLERDSIQLITHCCSFVIRVSPTDEARKNLRALRPVICELLSGYSDRMNLSEVARPLIEYAFNFKRTGDERVSPVLEFVYEIFSLRSELILQAFANEMFSLVKKHALLDQLLPEERVGGKEKQEWMEALDRIFDLVQFVLSSETLSVRKGAFDKFKGWLASLGGVVGQVKDRKQLGEMDAEHGYKRGFLAYVSGIAVPLLTLFEAQPAKAAAGSSKAQEGQ